MLLSFVVILVSSAVVYYEPHGRTAYWADWRLLGLTKEQWDAVHLTSGVLLVLAGFLHLWYNWKPVTTYLKDKARRMRVFTRPFVIALGINLFVVAGTLSGWPPMQQILDFSAWLKEGHVAEYGNPPYGHAELSSLSRLAGQTGLDLAASLAALGEAGVVFDSPEQTLAQVARANDTTPKALFRIMKRASGDSLALPAVPPEGTGKVRIVDLAGIYGLDPEAVLAALAAADIGARGSQTMKEAAAANQVEVVDVWTVIRDSAP
jgi:hypothetical protein